MSKSIEPCYCQQACDYEELLSRFLEMFVDEPNRYCEAKEQGNKVFSGDLKMFTGFNKLVTDTRKTLNKYKKVMV